jgi:hypothetical protein
VCVWGGGGGGHETGVLVLGATWHTFGNRVSRWGAGGDHVLVHSVRSWQMYVCHVGVTVGGGGGGYSTESTLLTVPSSGAGGVSSS